MANPGEINPINTHPQTLPEHGTQSPEKEERVKIGEKILIIPESVKKEMQKLDAFVAKNEVVAEVFGWGLTRETGMNEEKIEEFIVPDENKIFNFKSLLLTQEQRKLMDLLTSASSLVMKVVDGELVVIPDGAENKEKWLRLSSKMSGSNRNLNDLVGFTLPESIEEIEKEIQKRSDGGAKELALRTDWELVLSGASVIVTRNFITKVRERAAETGMKPHFTMHHHPNFQSLKSLYADKTESEKNKYYKVLLGFSLADLQTMYRQNIDLFEVRALGTAEDMNSLEAVTSKYYSVEDILKKGEPLQKAIFSITEGSEHASPGELEILAKNIFTSLQSLEHAGYPSAVVMEFYTGSEKLKKMKKEFAESDLTGMTGKKFLAYHLSKIGNIGEKEFPLMSEELFRIREETQIETLVNKLKALYDQGGETQKKISNLVQFFPDLFDMHLSTDASRIHEVVEAVNHFLGSELESS